jgi:hypothetical protein
MNYTNPLTLLLAIGSFLFSHVVSAQDKTTTYKVGDRVEAEYTTWYPGKVVEVLYNGDQYKVELYPPDGGKPFLYTFPKFRLRPTTKVVEKKDDKTASKLVYGKYGCTASRYSNGSVEYIPKGSFVIQKNGQYTYYGFKKPSVGKFTVDKQGNLHFKGGYFDGGKAEKIDRPDKFFLVFPANPDNRWTCGLADGR